jgi:hypothetical protein
MCWVDNTQIWDRALGLLLEPSSVTQESLSDWVNPVLGAAARERYIRSWKMFVFVAIESAAADVFDMAEE